jgi:hypothetical protein
MSAGVPHSISMRGLDCCNRPSLLCVAFNGHKDCFLASVVQDSAMEGPPVPGGVANQLQTFQGALPVLTDLSTLITALQTQEDNFLGTTSAPGPFPPSSTATYLAWVAVTR